MDAEARASSKVGSAYVFYFKGIKKDFERWLAAVDAVPAAVINKQAALACAAKDLQGTRGFFEFLRDL